MKILFSTEVHSFEKATIIEKAFHDLDIHYEVKITDKPNGMAKRPRAIIGKTELAAVVQCMANHKDWSAQRIGKYTNVGKSTVSRIMAGTHVLQTKAKKK